MNVCEHGDHAAPAGQRFCSRECILCEMIDHDSNKGCTGICQRNRRATTEEEVIHVYHLTGEEGWKMICDPSKKAARRYPGDDITSGTNGSFGTIVARNPEGDEVLVLWNFGEIEWYRYL